MTTLRRAVIRARGHPLIRASHDKTLELTTEQVMTARATCVVGVRAELDLVALALLRGRVRLTLSAAGHQVTGTATINPEQAIAGRVVLRRSDQTDPDTLAVRSSLTARELSPELIAALAGGDSTVTLTVEEVVPRQALVLLGPPRPGEATGRRSLLWRAADAAVDLAGETEPGRAAQRAAGLEVVRAGGTVAANVGSPETAAPAAAVEWLSAAAAAGARFAPVSGGTDPLLALVAAGLPSAPALWLGRLDRRAVRQPETAALLRNLAVPAVLTVPVAQPEPVLDAIAATSPGRRIAAPDGELDLGLGLTWTTVEHAATMIKQCPDMDAPLILAAVPGADATQLTVLVRALAEAGIPARTLADALRPAGVTRRWIYDTLATPDR
ncbi:MAG: DUF371 domain-containing protein [Sporichthyaceae bacterium]|nr:DUF371 domain-containing protein [Sporichthyaceae bacterium]